MFNRDIAPIKHAIRLHSSKYLADITDLAQDKKRWWGQLASQNEKAAEESQTKNLDTSWTPRGNIIVK